jgi:hypothetical protein
MIDMQCATLGVTIAYIEGYGSTPVLETSLDSGRRKGVEKSNSGWVIDSSLACSGNVLMADCHILEALSPVSKRIRLTGSRL